MNWIPCTERTPTTKGHYLTFIPQWGPACMDISLWDGEWRVFADDDWNSLDYYRLNIGPIDVTHWMPLPERPEGYR